MTGQAAAFKKAGVKAILFSAAPPQAASLAGVAASQKLDVPIVANGPGWTPQLLTTPAADALLANYYVVSSMAPLTVQAEGVQKFLSEYQAANPKGTPSSNGSLYAYAGAQIADAALTKACENKDLTRQGVLDALRSLNALDTGGTIAGTLDFTDPARPPGTLVYTAKVSKDAPGRAGGDRRARRRGRRRGLHVLMRLDGKVAIVTGAARGLGRAYAEALAAAGADVVVNDVDEAVREVAAVAEVCPVGSTEAADALVERAVAEFGRLDVMVTNAGVLRDKVLWKMSDDDFDTVVDTHLRGTFTCARAAAIRMRAQEEGGRIIVVGSPAGQYGNFGQTNYSGRQGRDRGLRAHVGDGARPRADHGQRDRADGLDADDGVDPDLRAARGPRRSSRRRCGASTRSAGRRTARRWSSSSPPTRRRA